MNHGKASYTCQTNVSAIEVATDCRDIFSLLYCKVSHFFFQPVHCHIMGIFPSLPFDLYLIRVQKYKVLVTWAQQCHPFLCNLKAEGLA